MELLEIVPNQGKGAATSRIEIMRNNFHRMRFDSKCDPGMKSLAWYHEKIDQDRRIGLGPNHDWASHSCDAVAIAPITFKTPKIQKPKGIKPRVNIA